MIAREAKEVKFFNLYTLTMYLAFLMPVILTSVLKNEFKIIPILLAPLLATWLVYWVCILGCRSISKLKGKDVSVYVSLKFGIALSFLLALLSIFRFFSY